MNAPSPATRAPDASLPAGYPFRPEWEWTPAEVAAALAEKRVTLVDCRRPPELAAAKIAGALWIPMDETPARLEEFRALPQPLVIHCHHGVRSLRVAAFLRENGIPADSLAAGIDQWSLAVDPGVPRY
jgi:rhodanese-related sulfurtransferase